MYGSLPVLSKFSPVSVGSNKLMYLQYTIMIMTFDNGDQIKQGQAE